jgi:TnpA family transposase
VTCRFQLWSVPDLWNLRASGRGVLLYWHVERGSVVIHSQRLNCSASEVHAMVDGAIRHGTDMHVEANYVDSHGQSEVVFGITKLLGFCRGSSGSTPSSSTAPRPANPTPGPSWRPR